MRGSLSLCVDLAKKMRSRADLLARSLRGILAVMRCITNRQYCNRHLPIFSGPNLLYVYTCSMSRGRARPAPGRAACPLAPRPGWRAVDPQGPDTADGASTIRKRAGGLSGLVLSSARKGARSLKKASLRAFVWQSAITSAAGGQRFLRRSRRTRHIAGSMAVQFVLPA